MPDPQQQATDPYASLPDSSDQSSDPYAHLEDTSHLADQDFSAPKDNKEGLYTMAGPKGVTKVPYSKVMDAYKAGWRIDPVDQRRFAADKTAEMRGPVSHRMMDSGISNVLKPTPQVETPEAFDIVTASPEKWSKDWVRGRIVDTVRAGIDLLPTVGGILGGVAAGVPTIETGPGVIAAAAAGAGAGQGVGEAARQQLNESVFHDPKMSAKESAKKIAVQAAVGALSEATGRVGGKMLAPAQKMFTDTAIASKAARVPLLPSEAAGKAPTYIEKYLKGSILTSGMMDKFRAVQNTQTKAAVERIANRISSFRGTPEQLGELVQDGIAEHTKEFRALQNQMYDDIATQVNERDVLVPVKKVVKTIGKDGKPVTTTTTVMQKAVVDDVMPSTASLKIFAQKQLRELSLVEQVLDPNLLSQSKSMLQTIIDAPNNMTFAAMRAARSDTLAKVRELDQALAGKQAGLAKKMAELFDSSIMDAVKKSKIPGLEQAVRDADDFTRNEHEMFSQDLIDKIVKTKKPEAIATLLRGNTVGNQETRDLFSILPANLHGPVRRQVLEDAMRQSTNLNSKVFNERKFAATIAKIGDERGQIIFGNNWNNVKELTGLLERINGPTGLGGGSGAALSNLSEIKAISVALAAIPADMIVRGEVEAGGITLGTQVVGFRAAAYLMTHPSLTSKLITGLREAIKLTPYAPIGAYNVSKGQQKLKNTRKEAIMRSPTRVRVDTPDGQAHFFPNEAAASKFRQAAGVP